MSRNILLSFDIEEFDLPKEFDQPIEEKEMYEISKQGLIKITNLLRKYKTKATFFITTNFALKYPKLIKELSESHEIASHGYSHSDNYLNGLSRVKKAKQELEKITRKEVKGFRAPRFEINNIGDLHNLGFTYDSSIHPTIAPGKYLRLNQIRIPHKIGKITEIPLSTLPLFPFMRAPINWYMFRHFPKSYRQIYARINYNFSNYLTLIFHPWEFVDISRFNIPNHFKKDSGKTALKNLEDYIIWCKKREYRFLTFSKFIESYLPTRTIEPQRKATEETI